jgi:hypothetical protein
MELQDEAAVAAYHAGLAGAAVKMSAIVDHCFPALQFAVAILPHNASEAPGASRYRSSAQLPMLPVIPTFLAMAIR